MSVPLQIFWPWIRHSFQGGENMVLVIFPQRGMHFQFPERKESNWGAFPALPRPLLHSLQEWAGARLLVRDAEGLEYGQILDLPQQCWSSTISMPSVPFWLWATGTDITGPQGVRGDAEYGCGGPCEPQDREVNSFFAAHGWFDSWGTSVLILFHTCKRD